MRQYELVYILHPDLEGSQEVATGAVTKLVGELEGRVLAEDQWGKRRLAYPIRRLTFGVYVVVTLELPPEAVGRLERELGLMDEVLRHLLVAAAKSRKRVVKPTRPRSRAKQPADTRSEDERRKELDLKLEEIIGGSEEAIPASAPRATETSERDSSTISIEEGEETPVSKPQTQNVKSDGSDEEVGADEKEAL